MINAVRQLAKKTSKDIYEKANRLYKKGNDSLPDVISKATSKETLVGGGLLGAVGASTIYSQGDDQTKEAVEDIAMVGAGVLAAGAGFVPMQRVVNKLYKKKAGAMSSKVVKEAPIEVPGFYSGGTLGQIGALAGTVPGTVDRIRQRFFNLKLGAGVKKTGLGTQTQASIDKAHKYRQQAQQSMEEWAMDNPLPTGRMTKKERDKLVRARQKEMNQIDAVKDYQHAERVAHYDIEKDYVNLLKFGQKVPPDLQAYMSMFMSRVTRPQLSRAIGGGHKLRMLELPWKDTLKGRKDTVYLLNKNVNPDSVTWDMMKDPVYHNLMVKTQAKHGLNVTLDQIYDYAKKEGLNVKKRRNGNLMINYSPRGKSNYLKGGTNAMLEFEWDRRRKRAIPTWTNTDVFDLIGTDKLIRGNNVIIFTEPHKVTNLKSLDFLEKKPRKITDSVRVDRNLPEIEVEQKDFFSGVDSRLQPKGVLSKQKRDLMNSINAMAENATSNYSMKMDPDIKERLTRRAVAGLTLGLPVGLGIYGAFEND